MKFLVILMLTAALIGCAASGEVEPTVELDNPTAVPPTATKPSPTNTPSSAETAVSGESVAPAEADPSKITPSPIDENATPHVAPQPGVPGGDAPADSLTALAIDSLTQYLQIDAKKISVVSVEEVQWPSSALGCPREGMNYLTVITPGYKIVLQAGDTQYNFHTDEDQSIILCVE